MKCHFIRGAVKQNLIRLKCLPTNGMVADTMIKPLPRGMHRKFCGSMGLGKVRAGKSKMNRVEEVDKDSKGHGSGGLGV